MASAGCRASTTIFYLFFSFCKKEKKEKKRRSQDRERLGGTHASPQFQRIWGRRKKKCHGRPFSGDTNHPDHGDNYGGLAAARRYGEIIFFSLAHFFIFVMQEEEADDMLLFDNQQMTFDLLLSRVDYHTPPAASLEEEEVSLLSSSSSLAIEDTLPTPLEEEEKKNITYKCIRRTRPDELLVHCPVVDCERVYLRRAEMANHAREKHTREEREAVAHLLPTPKSSRVDKNFRCPFQQCPCGYKYRRDLVKHWNMKHGGRYFLI
jgi:hypothetical protein